MSLYEKIKTQEECLSVIGLGYVGMPIAVAFAKKGIKVIGFDLNKEKIELYKRALTPQKRWGTRQLKIQPLSSLLMKSSCKKQSSTLSPSQHP